MPSERVVRIAVCAATFRRPLGLERLLRGLDGLEFGRPDPPRLEIVIVDNDPEGSARRVCDAVEPSLRWPLRYALEPRRGISFARNRAVSEAREWADFIGFIDDDEVPSPRWLEELLSVQARFDADVVGGPVVRRFESAPPQWVLRGHYFEDARFATGAPVRDPATNNVLIRVSALDGVEPLFDERYALTGGEDTHLFLRLGLAGRKMVWADEAEVVEWVPPTRTRMKWVLQRVYRTANTWSRCESELFGSPRVTAKRTAAGLGRVALGLATLPFSCMLGRHWLVRSLWLVAIGAGHLTGMIGLTYEEYLMIHGS